MSGYLSAEAYVQRERARSERDELLREVNLLRKAIRKALALREDQLSQDTLAEILGPHA